MSFILIILIVLLLVLNIRLGRYSKKFYWVFELSHFLMGFLIAGLIFMVFTIGNTHIILAVLVIGIIWELWEYVSYNVPLISKLLKKYFNYFTEKQTLKDTLLDLTLDFSGAVVFAIFRSIFQVVHGQDKNL